MAQNPGSSWSDLRAQFRSVNLLVLEDLENLECVPLARDELIHTLDALDVYGASIIVSCRTVSSQWSRTSWPPRVVNRLIGELAVRIDPPGLASRRRYILDRARTSGLTLTADAIESLAESAYGYHTLDGWLARLGLNTGMGQPSHGGKSRPLGLSSVTAVLHVETSLATDGLRIEEITRALARKFDVRISARWGAGQPVSVVKVRHLAMYLARLHIGLSFATIGTYFSSCDAATVRYACKATAGPLSDDPAPGSTFASFRQSPQRSSPHEL